MSSGVLCFSAGQGPLVQLEPPLVPQGGSAASSSCGQGAASGPRARQGAALFSALALAASRRRRSCKTTARARRKSADGDGPKSKFDPAKELPSNSNFYAILGVAKDASQEEIRTAYKRIIRETHPDVNNDPNATEIFIQAQEAFRWLSDPQQREVYDGVGGVFGEDALYDYTDEPILGALNQINEITQLNSAIDLVNVCRKNITVKREVKIDTKILDKRKRFKKNGIDRLLYVKEFFFEKFNEVLAYPSAIRALHPFERLSIELALEQHRQEGGVLFGQALGAIKALKRRIGEEVAYRCQSVKQAERGRLATFIADAGIKEIFYLMQEHEPIFLQFRAAQWAMMSAPKVDLDKPTIVFIGAPNVGKSSLVRSISTGRSQVSDFVYTTKKLTIGHIWHFIAGTPLLIHGQVMDSPGMREPPGENANPNLMDELTLGSLQHLPTGVVYVFDPNPAEHGLMDVEDQIELRNSLRKKFPRRPWCDVITKADYLSLSDEEDTYGAKENIAHFQEKFPDALVVSALDGTGLGDLNTAVRQLLEDMTRVVRQLQRSKIRALRMGADETVQVGKEALSLR